MIAGPSAQEMIRQVMASDVLNYTGLRVSWIFKGCETYIVLYDRAEAHTYALLSIGRWLQSSELSFEMVDYLGMYGCMKQAELEMAKYHL